MAFIDRAAVTFDLWNTLIFEFDNKLNSRKRRELRTEYSLDALRGLGESLEWVKFHEIFGDLADEITAGHDGGTDAHFHKWVELGLSLIDPDLPHRLGGSGITHVGDAIDIRIRDLSQDHILYAEDELREELGNDFDIINEGTHIHIEYDPD